MIKQVRCILMETCSKVCHLKTYAKSSIIMCEHLEPMQTALRYMESMASPFWLMIASCERHGL